MILTSSALVQRQTALIAEHAATAAPEFEVSMVSQNKHRTMSVNLRHITAAAVALNQPSAIGALAPPLILTQLLQRLLCFRSRAGPVMPLALTLDARDGPAFLAVSISVVNALRLDESTASRLVAVGLILGLYFHLVCFEFAS